MFTERFESDELDRSVWVPWYLPHWSSRATSAATYEVGGGELRLSIPPEQPLWAEGGHETPLRLSGIETAPELSGEICVMEVFGTRPQGVGMGLRRFRDPALTEDWAVVDLPIDVSAFHVYGVSWRPGSLEFTVDGDVVKRVEQAPSYPVQLELAVFDFPDKSDLVDGTPTASLVVSEITVR